MPSPFLCQTPHFPTRTGFLAGKWRLQEIEAQPRSNKDAGYTKHGRTTQAIAGERWRAAEASIARKRTSRFGNEPGCGPAFQLGALLWIETTRIKARPGPLAQMGHRAALDPVQRHILEAFRPPDRLPLLRHAGLTEQLGIAALQVTATGLRTDS